MTPSTTTVKQVTKQVFDLDTFTEKTLTKDFTVAPVATYQEFLERLGNDTSKVIDLLNVALISQARETARLSENGWNEFATDENGEETDKVAGPFSGTPADTKTVNSLVLTLAKTVFGYNKDAKIEVKRASKDKAIAMIKGNDEIRAGLKASMTQAAAAE